MLPRMVLRVRRGLHLLPMERQSELAMDGPEISARWRQMLTRAEHRSREVERRLETAEAALNRLR